MSTSSGIQQDVDLQDGGPTTVWIVEDNAPFRTAVATLLNQTEGLLCEKTFGSSEEALAELGTSTPPDVILMDISLPGMNGIECLRHVRSHSPATQVLMLTVFDDNDRIFRAICSGASGYLLKSESGDKIVQALRDVLKGGAPMNAQIARRVLDMFASFSAPKEDYRLTTREKEILRHLVDGLSKKEVADRLFLSFHTIDMHMRSIYTKLQVHSKSEAVAKALKEHLL